MFNENYFITTQGALHVSPTEAGVSFTEESGSKDLAGSLLVWDFVIPWACLCLFWDDARG